MLNWLRLPGCPRMFYIFWEKHSDPQHCQMPHELLSSLFEHQITLRSSVEDMRGWFFCISRYASLANKHRRKNTTECCICRNQTGWALSFHLPLHPQPCFPRAHWKSVNHKDCSWRRQGLAEVGSLSQGGIGWTKDTRMASLFHNLFSSKQKPQSHWPSSVQRVILELPLFWYHQNHWLAIDFITSSVWYSCHCLPTPCYHGGMWTLRM